MATDSFYIQEMPNGMTLVGQRMEHVSSTAISILVPGGASRDPDGLEGAAAVAAEWRFRGAGERDSRQLTDALDALGCQHSHSVLGEHTQLTAAQLGRNLPAVLAILADLVRRPRLAEETFDSCRQLILQDLISLEDEPARKCNVLLREKFFPHPLGRCAYGREESLREMDPAAVRRHAMGGLTPVGSILAVAGNIDWGDFVALTRRHFGDWRAAAPTPIVTRAPQGGLTFLRKESAQAHIALAHPSVTPASPYYYPARLAESVLSGGMSSRLFIEVRDKRGLAYHVSTRYHSLKDHAGLFTYVGTPPHQAQETLAVTVGELRRIAEGIQDEEILRSRTQLKSSLILQGESTVARAGALVSDWYHLARLRTLEEISRSIDGVTIPEVLEYLRLYPAEGFTSLLIAPQELDMAAAGVK
jgi:predicted Zn-dependent peptidase